MGIFKYFIVLYYYIFGHGYLSTILASPDLFSFGTLFFTMSILLPPIIAISLVVGGRKNPDFSKSIQIGKGLVYGAIASILISASVLIFNPPPDFGGMFYILLILMDIVYLIIGLIFWDLGKKSK